MGSVGLAAPGARPGVGRGKSLLRIELDDELLLDRRGDLPALGPAQHLRGELVVVRLQPCGDLGDELGRVTDHRLDIGAGLERNHVVLPHLVGGDVDAAAVDRPVPVPDELAGLAARGGEAEAHEHVVEAALEDAQQVLAGDALLAGSLLVVVAELLLEDAVVAARLLLLPQLHAVLGLLLAPAAMIAGRVGAALDAALVGQAALALEEQLLPLTAALLALGRVIACHSDPSPLPGAAAVVCLGGDVLDAGDLEPGGLQRADRGLATRAGALHEDLDLLHALLDALAGRRVGGHLGGERRRLARALEAGAAGGLPRDDVAFAVREGDDRVVEAGLDVRLADRDVLANLAAAALGTTGGWGHLLLRRLLLAGDRHPLRALAGARVGLGILTAHREAAAMAQAAVGADLHQALDVLGALAAQIALDRHVVDGVAQLGDLVVREVADVGVRRDAQLGEHLVGGRATHPVDVGETDLDALVERDVDPGDASHGSS